MEVQRGKDVKQADHEKLDILMFGKSFRGVHQWLDEFFDGYSRGEGEMGGGARYHWCERHHLQAIHEKYPMKKNDNEYEAAKFHIITDWVAWKGQPEFPKNKEEVIRLLDEKLGFK